MKFFNRTKEQGRSKRERALQLMDEVKQAAMSGRWKEVIKRQKELAQVLEEMGDVEGKCECYATAASAYIAMSDYPNAIISYENALQSVKELESEGIHRPDIEAVCYNGLATLYNGLGEKKKASEYREKSTRLLNNLDDARLKRILGK